MQTPSIGRIVHAVGAGAHGNGTDVAPGIVTRVWATPEDGYPLVNGPVLATAGLTL